MCVIASVAAVHSLTPILYNPFAVLVSVLLSVFARFRGARPAPVDAATEASSNSLFSLLLIQCHPLPNKYIFAGCLWHCHVDSPTRGPYLCLQVTVEHLAVVHVLDGKADLHKPGGRRRIGL